ncbi:MAG: MmgE/PrpD family protein [Burkholderiaceae bacterium]
MSNDTGITACLADWIASSETLPLGDVPRAWARHTLLDWIAVTIAGSDDPLTRMLADECGADDERGVPLIGLGRRARPLDAALINGAAGHALDFDDVSSRTVGHPTAPMAPAALAVALAPDARPAAPGTSLLRALIVGFEVQAVLGESLGQPHYQHGFHTTGTIGTFGATAACASLLGLTAARTRHALGLAATQAAGLKSMFGTMAKPLHAGKAAVNGLLAARLAARGFTADESAIEGEQGFARTQAPIGIRFPAAIDTRGGFAIESALFKYHAACYLTHATIDAVRQARAAHRLTLDDLASMTIHVAGNHRGVCDIETPRTGLNVKFSIRHLAALALDGADTAALGTYSDAIARDPRLGAARDRIALQVEPAGSMGGHEARVVLHTHDGRRIVEQADVGTPARDLDAQWRRLVAKAETLTAPLLGGARFARLVDAIDGIERLPTLAPLAEALR